MQEQDTQARRIAIFIDTLVGGGAEKVVMTLARQLVKMGHGVDLIVLKKRTEYQLPDVYPVHFLYPNAATQLNGIFGRQKHVKKLQSLIAKLEQSDRTFDLFLSNLEDCHYIVSGCGFSPCYYVMHNSVEETLIRTKQLGPLKYWKFSRALKSIKEKHLVTVSDGIRDEILSAGQLKPAKVVTIYNPFDIEHIKQMSQQENINIPATKYIIHVGRFAKQKRHDILLTALKQVPGEYKLVCLSGNSKKLIKLVNKMGLQARVIVPGFNQNPYPWIKQAELLVLSSDFEGFGNVLVEAIICGTKVVSTDCRHGPNEILTEELSQWLVPRRNSKRLGEKICNALKSEVNLSQTSIIAKVQAERIALQYLELIRV